MRREIVRCAYIIILLAGLAWFANWVLAGWLYPYAEGLVVGLPLSTSVELTASVKEVRVVEGQFVKKGEIVATTESLAVALERANLFGALAERQLKLAQLSVRRDIVGATLREAEKREHVVLASREQLSKIDGAASILTRNSTAEAAYRGSSEAEALRVEQRSIDEQLVPVTAAINRADSAVGALRDLYDDGNIRAPDDGTVYRISSPAGSVVRPGEPVVELVGTGRYILAFFETSRLYQLSPGRRVTVYPGGLTGRISRVDAVALALPREFQSALRPQERKQLVRIDLDAGQPDLPYFTKVSVY